MIEVRNNLPEFKRALETIKYDFQEKSVKAASRAAAGVIRDSARGIAPMLQSARKGRTAGVLKANIYSGVRRSQTPGMVRAVVSVKSGRKAKGDAFYWRFLEGGWIPRGPGNRLKGGRRTKALMRLRGAAQKITKYKFLQPAFNATQSAALAAFYERLRTAIAKYQAIK